VPAYRSAHRCAHRIGAAGSSPRYRWGAPLTGAAILDAGWPRLSVAAGSSDVTASWYISGRVCRGSVRKSAAGIGSGFGREVNDASAEIWGWEDLH